MLSLSTKILTPFSSINSSSSLFSLSKANYFDTVFVAVMKEKFINTIITNDSHFEEIKGIKSIKPLDY